MGGRVALVLEVFVNGERFTVAGEESLGVLSAHVVAAGKLGTESHGPRPAIDKPADILLNVSGRTNRGGRGRDEQLNWGPRLKLRLGDEVRITVRADDNYDSASRRKPMEDASPSAFSARKRFIEARSLYFQLRHRYGTRAEKKEKQWRRRLASQLR
jgi:hypothetical protein